MALVLLVVAVSLTFTFLVRLYVVPYVTPTRHWQYGLQVDTDSHFFHLEAMRVAAQLREHGWSGVEERQLEGTVHAQLIGYLYYLTGADRPETIFVVNALLAACSSLLLFLILRETGVSTGHAAVASFILCSGPMFLFMHSELLREPFIIPPILLISLGLLICTAPSQARGRLRGVIRPLAGAALAFIGLVITSEFRPYLILPILLGMIAITVGGILSALVRGALRPEQVMVLLGLLAATYVGVLRPARVQQYTESSIAATSVQSHGPPLLTAGGKLVPVEAEAWKTAWATAVNSQTKLTREMFTLPHWCTVEWKSTSWMIGALDAKLEGLACARQEFLRFCDQALIGAQADRNCDVANFNSAADVFTHLPRAAWFVLMVPFPNMWLDGFGGGGSGLRRAGYIIDGVMAYVLLLGLAVFAWRARSDRPHAIIVALGMVMILTIYGLGVPSQFILARMRLALFLPLLAFGFAGWLLWWESRRRDADG